jgi:hypothetical protein
VELLITEKKMFTKNKVSQSMIDAVNKVLGEEPTGQEDVLLNEAGTPIKEPTSTGMRVYGRSYGNSAKAKKDQTKSSVDDLKGPKTKELMQKDKEDYMKTKGKYDEAAKPDFLDMDKDGDKKEPMKKALGDKKKVAEELKGDQHKIDANKNNKVDAHDFAILRGKKKVKEDMYFAKKLIEGMKRSDIPAFIRKARGDAPLTPAEVKSGSKDSISDPKNLAKARNEEIEQIDEKDPCWSNYTQVGMKKKNGREVPNCVPSKGVPAAKGYKKEEVESLEQKEAYEGSDAAITTDTLAGRMPGGRTNSFKSFKTRVNPVDKEGNGNPEKVPSQEPDETPSSNSIKAKPVGAIERTDNLDPKYGKPNTFKEAVVPFDGPYTKVKANIKDKSGAVHSPMSRAKNLAQQAFKKVQDKTKIKSEMMLGKAGGTSESKKCK